MTKIDDNVFFRQATTRICGHLEIDVALHECIIYLKKVVPVENLLLSLWVPEMESIKIIARATKSVGEKLDTVVHMRNNARLQIEKWQNRLESSKWLDTDIINMPVKDPVMKAFSNQFDLKRTSFMHMILETVDRPLCSITAVSIDDQIFTNEHARYLNLIKEPLSIAMSNALKHREVVKLKEKLSDDNRFLHRQLHHLSGDHIIGADFGLKDVMTKVRQVSQHESPVLLLGETGVGKDIIANTIHFSSARSEGPLITVNCGAIPDNLLDSELFGHEKGAFTGAISKKRGRFERANKGTIFLDEIGELPPQAQVRLLRVLQNKEIERVGGTKQISLDIRILAATNKNLEQMVKSNQFRADLWFRLNVFPLRIPPLRERKEDIPALVQFFMERKSKELKLQSIPKLAENALDQLLKYDWPGNIREMANVIEHALIVSGENVLSFEQLNPNENLQSQNTMSYSDFETPSLETVMKAYFEDLLRVSDGKIHGKKGAAEIAGLNASTLRSKMYKLGIEYGRKAKG